MSEDTYKGESPAKKIARAMFWQKALANLRRPRLVRGKFVVLASREGGDISTLLGLGVRATHIVGVDACQEAARACREKFPSVQIECGDICDVAYALGRDTAAAMFLDFCGPLSPSLTKTTYRAIQRACVTGAVVGIGLMRGREKVVGRGLIERMHYLGRDTNREYEMLRKEGIDVSSDNPPRDNDEARLQSEVRHAAALLDINDRARTFAWKLRSLGSIFYQSTVDKSRGVPMMYVMARKEPLESGWSQADWDQCLLVTVRPRTGDSMDIALRRSVAIAARAYGTARAALIFNVPISTATAWLAHDTRRTFGSIPQRRHGDDDRRERSFVFPAHDETRAAE